MPFYDLVCPIISTEGAPVEVPEPIQVAPAFSLASIFAITESVYAGASISDAAVNPVIQLVAVQLANVPVVPQLFITYP